MEKYLRRFHTGDSHKDREFPPTALTVSRQCGAGFTGLKRRLLEYLENVSALRGCGWALFDQSLIGRIIEAGCALPEPAPFSKQHSKFSVTPTLIDFLHLPVDQWTLQNHTAHVIRSLAHSGSAVIVGRAGNFITSDLPNTFHVRLVAGTTRRIDETARRYGITVGEAKVMVEETDKARARFVKRCSGSEIDEVSSYHLVINTDTLPDELVIRIIGDSLLEWSSLGGSAPGLPCPPHAAST